eukprot:g4586.t1
MRKETVIHILCRLTYCNFRDEDEEKPKQSKIVQLGSIGAGAMFLFGKGKYLLGALKLTKLSTLVSMGLSTSAYAFFYGWPFAVGMVGLIAVHECGHALVMRSYGVPFSPMVFIPFMGAAVAMKDNPRDVYEEAVIAFGGPVLGTVGAVGVGLAGHATGSQFLIGLCDFGLMINLFNMLPIGSMDGGRIANAISKYSLIAGLGIGGGVIYSGAISNPIFYLIVAASAFETYQRFFGSKAGSLPPSYYKISGGQRVALGASYVGLIAFLVMSMHLNSKRKLSTWELEELGDETYRALHEEFNDALKSDEGDERVRALANVFARMAEHRVRNVEDVFERNQQRYDVAADFRVVGRRMVENAPDEKRIALDSDLESALLHLDRYCASREMNRGRGSRVV